MRHHSLEWNELPVDTRRFLEALQIGPGERVYFRKIARLTDSTLANAAGQHCWQAADQQHVVQALAARFSRDRRTIRRRLRRLPNSLRAATASIDAVGSSQEPA